MLVLPTTPQVRRYYEFRRDALMSTKNHQGGLNDLTAEADGKVFEVINSSRCPVKTIENFLKDLNPKLDCQFQRPRKLSGKFNPVVRMKPCGIVIQQSVNSHLLI